LERVSHLVKERQKREKEKVKRKKKGWEEEGKRG